jgi:hypothetical protein
VWFGSLASHTASSPFPHTGIKGRSRGRWTPTVCWVLNSHPRAGCRALGLAQGSEHSRLPACAWGVQIRGPRGLPAWLTLQPCVRMVPGSCPGRTPTLPFFDRCECPRGWSPDVELAGCWEGLGTYTTQEIPCWPRVCAGSQQPQRALLT